MSTATLRYTRLAPRKARVIADLIRGKNAVKSIHTLRLLRKAGAEQFYKLLVSAVANAEDQGASDIDGLFVARVMVDQGPTLKRWRPRAQGRATRINKKTSHIFVELDHAESK